MDRRRYVGFVDWQQAVSLGIVVATAVWMCWRWIRRRRTVGQGDGLCGCSGSRSGGWPGRIVCQARKGERPRVVVHFR
ncbi:MAG: hypothetical protein RMN51_12755 [Verrucomicrobiota bacterium]|nr:hypothetical protein [Limisphaera sp.]MDW8382964.1 hypothetical protein [Verrucomicrobiota bacterium]